MAFPPRSALLGLLLLSGCPAEEIPERLSVSGTLDRDSITSSNSLAVPIDFTSEGARGEWWPCDLRLTALGCVDGAHVNVYVALPSVTSFDGVGGAACVSGDVAEGVYEALQRKGGVGEYGIGQDVSVFVLVASDQDDVPGANLVDDEETKAATRLASGTFRVESWGGLTGIGATIDAATADGREVDLAFYGPTTSGDVIPIEGPGSCVDSALVVEAEQ